MDSEIRRLLPRDFPEELIHSAESLLDIGSAKVVWKYEDAIKAVQWYANHDYAILGGDVCCKENEGFDFIGDNWYLNQDQLDWAQYIEESKKKTVSYIENHFRRNGNGYYYALVTASKGWKRPR